MALVLLAPAPTVGILAAAHWTGPVGQFVWAATKLWLVALPAVWYLCIDRGRISLSPVRQGGIAAGMLSGVGILIAVVAAYALLGRSLIDPSAMRAQLNEIGLGDPRIYLAATLYWIFINSVIEEYVWRWFVYRQGERLMPAAAAVVVSAAAFTVHHVFALAVYFDWPIVVVGSAGVFAGGVIWSWLYARYGSIWPGWISHAWADVAVFGVGAWIAFG